MAQTRRELLVVRLVRAMGFTDGARVESALESGLPAVSCQPPNVQPLADVNRNAVSRRDGAQQQRPQTSLMFCGPRGGVSKHRAAPRRRASKAPVQVVKRLAPIPHMAVVRVCDQEGVQTAQCGQERRTIRHRLRANQHKCCGDIRPPNDPHDVRLPARGRRLRLGIIVAPAVLSAPYKAWAGRTDEPRPW